MLFATIDTNCILKPHGVVITSSFKREAGKARPSASLMNLEKGQAGEYNGYLSPASARAVKKIVENWLTSIEISTNLKWQDKNSVYPTFVTLTLPCKQIHSDNTIKNECLDPFLEYLRNPKIWNVKGYVWRAETQKNGNIHFHVICDRWIDAQAMRKKWNQIINRLGYVDMYRDFQNYVHEDGFTLRREQLVSQAKQIWERAKKAGKLLSMSAAKKEAEKAQRAAYDRGVAENWSNPNTTDIHKIRNLWSVSAYVVKYLTKAPDQKPLPPGVELYTDENGKTYAVEYRTETMPDGREIRFEVSRTEHKPVFVCRKVRGRIWGRADVLHEKTAYPTYTVETTYLERPDEPNQPLLEVSELSRPDVAALCDGLKAAASPEKLRAINEKINSRYVYVIPLVGKVGDYIAELSPELSTEYQTHYRTMFYSIYETPGNSKDVWRMAS